jgi:hypothetical protein
VTVPMWPWLLAVASVSVQGSADMAWPRAAAGCGSWVFSKEGVGGVVKSLSLSGASLSRHNAKADREIVAEK